MKKFWAACKTWGRAFLATTATVVVATGHIPSTTADLVLIAKGAVLAFLPVIVKALDPKEDAYGAGSNKE